MCIRDRFNILDAGNHTFRPDIVGILYLLNVASSGILVVAAKCFEHFADSDIPVSYTHLGELDKASESHIKREYQLASSCSLGASGAFSE